ncbi:D-alanyl-D-alanine carboxypeptidase [Planotetraspora thailandica]|uniref:D-alanyl-D-alanine carboxypeptidase n=1 Tax=Planotetraspora thailandica TaxID=487172 RepID=A0A8J4DF04_9ACTN|nr:D-alanyl-D-alanine carboxypeptidase [Planotetraspora thailandica]
MFTLVTGLSAPALARSTQAPASASRVADSDAPPVYGRATYLLDASTGTVRLDDGAHKRMPVASLTKVMTAYLTLKLAKPTDTITITSGDVNYANDNGGTSADLDPGDKVMIKDALYGLLLPSGADVAHALARTYGPGVDGFVAKMNDAAKQLGLNDTHYVNPDGLPMPGGDGYSTAADQAKLAAVALSDKTFEKVTSTEQYSIDATATHGAHTWTNTNEMLDLPGALGVKTGFTQAAGYCLAFAADRDGHRLIGVILGEDVSSRRFDTAAALLNWAADNPVSPETEPSAAA